MRNKSPLKAFFLLLLVPMVAMPVDAVMRWPLSYTRGFTLHLTDLDTGEPIVGAVIEVNWHKEYPAFETMIRKFKTVRRISNAKGQVKIRPHADLHIISHLQEMEIYLIHPMYQEIRYYLYLQKPFEYENENARVDVNGGNIEIRIRSFDEKYRKWTSLNGHNCESIRKDISLDNWVSRHFFNYGILTKTKMKKVSDVPSIEIVREFWDRIAEEYCHGTYTPIAIIAIGEMNQ